MKISAVFRLYEELNDFLPPHRRKEDFVEVLEENTPVKKVTDILGIPRGEIDLILVNGKSADFEYIIRDGDRVSLYPTFELLNIGDITRLREKGLRETKFIAHKELRSLAEYMQSEGFDVLFDSSLECHRIMEISREEKRIILVPDKHPSPLDGADRIIRIKQSTLQDQVRQIREHLDLGGPQ